MEALKFETSKAGVFGTPNAFRERKADREARATALLQTPVQYLSEVGLHYGTALANGQTLDVSGTQVSIKNPETLRCVICHGIHGKPTKQEEKRGDGWKANRLALISFFMQAGKVIVISATCIPTYILPRATPKNVTNYAELVKLYSGPTKPVKK
jgi:hypothetical protein